MSCSVTFGISELYSFWRPHEFDPSIGLSAFLPSEHLRSWREYRGDEIRIAAVKMRGFKLNWKSETPRAKYRVDLGSRSCESSLESVPGTRWLLHYHNQSSSHTVGVFIDAKTGARTTEDIVISPAGTVEDGVNPVVCALEPNRVLIGTSSEQPTGSWNFALLDVQLTIHHGEGGMFVMADKRQVLLAYTVPPYLSAKLSSNFLVIEGEVIGTTTQELILFHIKSGQQWIWTPILPSPAIFLLGDWCFITFGERRGSIEVTAIHLPSLLSTPLETTPEPLVLPRGLSLPYGNTFRLSKTTVLIYTVEAGYHIMLSSSPCWDIFDVQIDITAGRIYGNITLKGPVQKRPTAQDLANGCVYQSKKHRQSSEQEKLKFTPGLEVIMVGKSTGCSMHTLLSVNLYDQEERPLDWRAEQKNSSARGIETKGYLEQFDDSRGVSYCDAAVGLLLLRSLIDTDWEAETRIFEQAYWF